MRLPILHLLLPLQAHVQIAALQVQKQLADRGREEAEATVAELEAQLEDIGEEIANHMQVSSCQVFMILNGWSRKWMHTREQGQQQRQDTGCIVSWYLAMLRKLLQACMDTTFIVSRWWLAWIPPSWVKQLHMLVLCRKLRLSSGAPGVRLALHTSLMHSAAQAQPERSPAAVSVTSCKVCAMIYAMQNHQPLPAAWISIVC